MTAQFTEVPLFTDVSLSDLWVTLDVDKFSRDVFQTPYLLIKPHIYPRPKYKTFFIRKRSGALREIKEPRKALKALQYKVLEFLTALSTDVKPCVHGFVRKRSIVTNASRHCGKKTYHILNIDLEDFFPSITFYRVRGALQKAPFSFSHSVATVVAQLCTHDGVLPQGAPTSPFLSNIICRSLDRDLMALAKRHKSIYTRYADDMTFSFSVRNALSLPVNICSFDSGVTVLGNELLGIISGNGFRVNNSKTRISSRRHRLEVTGLTINKYPNVRRKFLDAIRGALHAWKTYGYAKAEAEWQRRCLAGLFDPHSAWRRQTRHGLPPKLSDVLRGRLLYLRMVRGKNDTTYARLAELYNSLSESEGGGKTVPVKPIVFTMEDVKRAILVIEWSGEYRDPVTGKTDFVGGQGTGFLYRGLGLITCDHILTSVVEIDDQKFEVDMSSPGVTVSEFKAQDPAGPSWILRVRARDQHRDIALLDITGDVGRRYFVSVESQSIAREHGFLAGYPNWSPGRPTNIADAKVLSTYVRQGLQRFEISMNIRQGNSGGVFLDPQFRVAGIAQRGASQTSGNDECLAAEELDSWLAAI